MKLPIHIPLCDAGQIEWGCLSEMFGHMFLMNSVRYFPIALALFFVLWVWQKDYFQAWRIQPKFPKARRLWYEFGHSFSTLLVFVLIGVAALIFSSMKLTQFYLDPHKYGLWYLPASFILLTIWHETWFYWMHRLVHHPLLFKYVHLTHHKSINPSPLAAYSFHPIEAFLEGIYLLLFVMIVPVHPLIVLLHTIIAMLLNIWLHSGYEFYPSGWTYGRISKWLNPSTHHNMHHSHVNCNYSLYCNFWDRILNTNHPEYNKYYENVVERAVKQRANNISNHGKQPNLS